MIDKKLLVNAVFAFLSTAQLSSGVKMSAIPLSRRLVEGDKVHAEDRKDFLQRLSIAFLLAAGMCQAYPDQVAVVDWGRAGVVSSPSADPEIINTCKEPISIEIDKSNTTVGVARKSIDDACAVLGFHYNFSIYGKFAFQITCGSGSKFNGYAIRDLGNYGPPRNLSGFCNQRRSETWETAHPTIEEDPSNPGVFNISDIEWHNENGGTDWLTRTFDLKTVASSPEIINHTFPLLPFPGGNRVLSRPVLFVHGLGQYYDTAWGVRSYNNCTVGGVTIDPQQVTSVTVAGKIRGITTAAYYQTSVSGGFGFQGTCQENGSTRSWTTPSTQLATLALAPSFGDAVQQTAWEQVWTAHPPVLIGSSFDGQDLVGILETWILEADVARNMTGTGWEVVRVIPGTRSEYNGQGVSKIGIVRAEMKFRVKSLASFWYQQAYVPRSAGVIGLVDPNPIVGRQYNSATAPDIIARIQRLKMGNDVNKNGLYFFNGFRLNGNGNLSQPLPWWNLAGPDFPNEPGESWTLYQALVQTLQMHYGDAWKTDASLQIDLVAHSRGGVTIREMLANARLQDPAGNPMPTGPANAANHIRTAVTSNSPHFGSYAATSWQSMPGEFGNSLIKSVKDSAKFEMELLDATVDPTFLAAVGAGYLDGSRASEKVAGWFLDQEPDGGAAGILTSPIWAPLTLSMDLASSVKRLPADIRLRMTGNWFWPKSVLATWEYPWGAEKIQRTPVDLDYAYSYNFDSRKASSHLAVDSDRVVTLVQDYPILPNGQDLDFQPLYSTTKGLGDLIRNLVTTNLSGLCDLSSDLRNASCYGGFDGLRIPTVPGKADWWISRINADLPLGKFWDDYSAGWFARSDALVQSESQQAVRDGTTWRPNQHPGKFHDPRTYSVRQFLTGGRFPDSLVPHGNLPTQFDEKILGKRFTGTDGEVIGASWMGHDIYCALAPDCRELLEQATGRVVRLPWDVATTSAGVAPQVWFGARLQKSGLDVTGDFKYGLMSPDTGLTGFSLSVPGGASPLLRVFWSPGGGVVLEQAGTTQTLIEPGYVANPRIERVGDLVTIRAVSWSGREYVFPISVSGLEAKATLDILVPEGSTSLPLLVGTGIVDPAYLDPRPSKQARVWFRDARGSDLPWTRPRILLENTGRVALHGAELRYRFRADPRRQVILDAPVGGIWRIAPVAGDVYELIASDPNAVVAPGAVWPSKEQGVVGLRFADWTPWDVFKDPSNDRNFGQVRLNETIRAFDGSGQWLWGLEVGETDPGRPAVKQVRVATREAAVNEPNISKPEIQVRNEGNVPLQNLEIRWHIQLPDDAVPVADVYYMPNSTVSFLGLGSGRWVIRVILQEWIQPGQTAATGSFGVHLTPYANWDRSQSPSNNGPDGEWNMNPWVEVFDASGERLWGQARDIVVPPPPPPPGDSGSVADLRVEAYNESPNEKNIVKPRVRVTNTGAKMIEGFRLEFPVVPERNLVPVIDRYYVPYCSSAMETRSTETVGVLDCRGVNLRGGSVWTDPVGGVFGMHYTDWSAWDATNDPAFAGMGAQYTPAPGVRVLP